MNTFDIFFHRLESQQEIEFLAAEMAASDPWLRLGISHEVCRRNLSSRNLEVWAAKKKAALVGVVLLQMRGAFTGYIVSIMVCAEYRGQGIGSCLLQFAESQVFSRTRNMFLCVSGFNESAQAFYRRHGYDTIGVLKDFLIEGEDEILMRKTIGPLRQQNPGEA